MAIFFKRIHDLRVDNDLRQKDIALILKVNINTYPHWESGMYEIPIDIIDKLAKFYNCSVNYLVGISNDKGTYGKKYDDKKLFLRLKQLRKDNHLSQYEIGNKLGFGQMNYSRYESGKVVIPFSKLYLLSRTFNISLDYLMGKSDNKTDILIH